MPAPAGEGLEMRFELEGSCLRFFFFFSASSVEKHAQRFPIALACDEEDDGIREFAESDGVSEGREAKGGLGECFYRVWIEM